MNYKLLKKVKDAGLYIWEAEKSIIINGEKGKGELKPAYDSGDLFYYPTLSELKIACQSMCVEKFKRGAKITISGQTSWWAMVSTEDRKNLIPVQSAHTPEEALTKLWLALKKIV